MASQYILSGSSEDVTDVDHKSSQNPLPNLLPYNEYPYKKICRRMKSRIKA